MPAPKDLIHETSSSTGTGNLTLAAVNGKVRFSDATYGFGTGGTDVFDYFISNRAAAEWETGTGSMSDANTLVRNTVLLSSNSNAAVNFSAGVKDVANDVPASQQVRVIKSVKDFGAVGDGSTDDTAAIQAAIDSFGSGDVSLMLPPGDYIASGVLTVDGPTSFQLFGAGLGSSTIRWTTAGGFDINFPTPSSTNTEDQVAVFRDLSLLAAVDACGTAIDVSWATAVGDTTVGLIVNDCFIGSRNKNTVENDYWTNAIKLTNCRRAYISGTAIDGCSLTTLMSRAVWCTGGSVEVHLTDCDITHCATGVDIEDECEGVFLRGVNMVYVDKGVRWHADAAWFGTDLSVINCHIAALTTSIEASRCAHAFISSNLIQKRDESTADYRDIDLVEDCNLWKIHHNHFQLAGTSGTEYGVHIRADAGNTDIDIEANTFANRDKAVWIENGATDIYVRRNRGVDSVTTMIDNDAAAGSNIVLEDNEPYTNNWGTLSGATPSVDASEFDYFLTSNGSATTITDFVNGKAGQIIIVVANDANTTIAHNADINLQGGTNWAMSAGNAIALIYQAPDTMWREIWRRGLSYGLLTGIPAAIDAIDGLTPAADRLAYYTGASSAALATFTAAGRNLVDDADAAAQRTTLGVGTGDSPQFTGIEVGHASDTTLTRSSAGVLAVEGVVIPTVSSTSTLTNKTLTDPSIIGTITEDVYTITDGAGFAIDPTNGSIQRVVLGANRTPTAANWSNGDSVTVLIDDGTAYTITWSTIGVVWKGGTAPTLATSGFTEVNITREGDVYRGVHVGDFAS